MSEYLSSARNYLLNRDDVGKPRPTTRRLPSMDHVYGHPPNKDLEGVREILGSWKFHQPSQIKGTGRDFTKLNLLSLEAGISNPKEHFQFRKRVDPRLPVKTGTLLVKYCLPGEEFTYGIPNRPSTPIKQVIGGEFGNNSALLIDELYRSRLDERKKMREQKFSPRSTKTNELYTSIVKERMKSFSIERPTTQGFKIRKYCNVPSRTDHKNSEYIKSKSLNNSLIQQLPAIQNESENERPNEAILDEPL